MNIIILILSIYGLTFIIRQSDGPWDLISRWRNWMMRLPIVGVQFYKLLDCPVCTGWWSGLCVYLLSEESYKLSWVFLWGLAGSSVGLILDRVLAFLDRE
jgi:hypothetical protein